MLGNEESKKMGNRLCSRVAQREEPLHFYRTETVLRQVPAETSWAASVWGSMPGQWYLSQVGRGAGISRGRLFLTRKGLEAGFNKGLWLARERFTCGHTGGTGARLGNCTSSSGREQPLRAQSSSARFSCWQDGATLATSLF